LRGHDQGPFGATDYTPEGARQLDRHRQASGHAGRIRREPEIAKLRDRKHSRFVENAGNNLHAVPNVLAVGEGDEVGVGCGHPDILPPQGEDKAKLIATVEGSQSVNKL